MPGNKPTFWTSDRIMHLIIGLAIAVCVVLLVRYLSGVLLPFFVACLIAYLLQPLVNFNRRLLHTKGRALASVVTLLDLIVVAGGIVYLFLPTIIKEVNELGAILHKVNTGELPMPPLYHQVVEAIGQYFNIERLRESVSADRLMQLISKGSSILQGSLGVLTDILSWVLTIIYVLFILIDYPQITRGFKLIVPHKFRPQFLVVLSDVSQSMNHYFRGQGCVALCAMVFYCVGFTIVGLPLAIPMGMLVGILYMIPYFQYITLIPVTAICFIYSLGGDTAFWTLLVKCGLVYVASQCICDYIITPHIMGKELGMNAAIILLSLSVWGCLMGIIGMIIALPVTSLILTYYARYISEPGASSKTAAEPSETKQQ